MSALLKIALFASAVPITASASAGPVNDRIYPAPKAPLTLTGLPAGTEFADVTTSDGLALRGLYRPASRADRPLLLVFHGNASSARTSIEWLGPAADEGYGILAAEYRGYNGGAGKPSAAGLALDAKAFWDEAKQRAGGRPIWVVGHSLGAAVSLGLARSERLDQLVTVGAFTSLKDMASGLQRAFVPDDYRNLDIVPLLDEPLAIVHGLRDQVVPWQMGQQLHKAAFLAKRTGRSYILIEGTHHPSGTAITSILNDIGRQKAGGRTDAPAGVKIVSFSE